MKKMILALCLIAATAQAADKQNLVLQEDAKDCTIDALNYEGLALMAGIIDNQVDWDKFAAIQVASAHSKQQRDWIDMASRLAWSNKNHGSAVQQGVLMYDSCVKALAPPVV